MIFTSIVIAGSDSPTMDAIVASMVIIVLCIGLFAVVSIVRKRMKTDTIADVPPTGFTLSELRDLHKSGQLSDEEFEKAKAKLIAVAKQPAPAKPDRTEMKGDAL